MEKLCSDAKFSSAHTKLEVILVINILSLYVLDEKLDLNKTKSIAISLNESNKEKL